MGNFPDYNGDGRVDVLDIMLAPEDRRQEVIDIVMGGGAHASEIKETQLEE